MHRLLNRQAVRIFGKSLSPDRLSEAERELLDVVSQTYEDYDKERDFLQHTLALNSSELNEKNRHLEGVLRSLADAQKLSHIGSWSFDLESGKLDWSEELFRIFELKPDQVEPSFSLIDTLIHPDDVDCADIGLEKTRKNGIFDEYYRLSLSQGKIK